MPNGIDVRRSSLHLSAVVGLGLLLSACSSDISLPDPNPNPTPTEQFGLIKGQIDTTKIPANSVKQIELELSTPVQAMGKFDLNLPKSDVMTGKNSTLLFEVKNESNSVFGLCTNVTTTAPASLRVYPINFLTTDKGQRIIAQLNATKSTNNFKAWWYSNMDVTFTYKGNCVGLGQINTTLTFKKGWNVLDTDINVGVATTYTHAPQPTTYIPWVKANESMTAQALSLNILEPWKNLPQYRNR